MIVITNAKILCPDRIIENGEIYIRDGIIDSIIDVGAAPRGRPHPGQPQGVAPTKIDAQHGLVMPGLTNTHMHLYSTFARGMALKGFAPNNFVEILEGLWWKLDKALTHEDIYYSALIPLIECIKSGTTTIIDHHASPNCVPGSLDKIVEALHQIPVRASLCYEVSDRDGEKIVNQGIEENMRFIKACGDSKMMQGLFGMHASFTISDSTLQNIVHNVHPVQGMHVHTAEAASDAEDSRKKYGLGIVERFHKHGLLNPKTILAHCVHISEKEMDLIAESKANVVHNPESNMNNAVGAANVPLMLAKGCCVGLGTDGMTSDMFQESKAAHLFTKHNSKDTKVGFSEAGKLLFENNHKIISNIFDVTTGKIEKGAVADVIILDYKPPTPLTHENFLGHFLFGMNSSNVATTIVNGKVLMENRELKGIDEEQITAKSREMAAKLWKRI